MKTPRMDFYSVSEFQLQKTRLMAIHNGWSCHVWRRPGQAPRVRVLDADGKPFDVAAWLWWSAPSGIGIFGPDAGFPPDPAEEE